MVKQLGVLTFFLKLSCSDLKRIPSIIRKLNETNFDISSLSCYDLCKIFNENPVLVARHFQYRVNVFKKLVF